MTIESPSLAASLRAAALAAAGTQAYPAASLYVVATPIGNLADLTLRAIHVLTLVDAIACEDTRHSAPLLRQLGVDKPLLPVHEHNERHAASQVLERLAAGERVAYISDAGTPAVSDPGAALVAAARAAGFRVMPVPGASSVVTALCAAGDADGASGGFCFAGFMPTKAGERARQLAAVVSRPETQVLFEAPHRIEALAKALGDLCPARTLTICRELTKQFETVVTMPCGEASSWLRADAHRTRGEFVLVLHALARLDTAPEAHAAEEERTLRILLESLPLKQSVALAADITGAPRNRLYQQALAMRSNDERDTDADVDSDNGPASTIG